MGRLKLDTRLPVEEDVPTETFETRPLDKNGDNPRVAGGSP